MAQRGSRTDCHRSLRSVSWGTGGELREVGRQGTSRPCSSRLGLDGRERPAWLDTTPGAACAIGRALPYSNKLHPSPIPVAQLAITMEHQRIDFSWPQRLPPLSSGPNALFRARSSQ